MSEEKKETDSREYSFTVVFHGINEEKLGELRDYLFEGYEPDFKEQTRRIGELLLFLQSYTESVLNDAKHADFDVMSEDVSEHPKNVIKSIIARSEITSRKVQEFLQGTTRLKTQDDNKQLDALIKYLQSMQGLINATKDES